MRRTITQILMILSIIVGLWTINSTTAYTDYGGIESNDIVDITYSMNATNGQYEYIPNYVVNVTLAEIPKGLYNGLLGMKIDEKKTVTIPSEDGYTSGEFANMSLIVDIHVNGIETNIRDLWDTSTSEEILNGEIKGSENQKSLLDELLGSPIFKALFITILLIFVYVKSIGGKSGMKGSKGENLT